MLDRQCVACHKPGTKGEKFDLTPARSYEAMTGYGSPSLKDIVIARYREQRSKAGAMRGADEPLLQAAPARATTT